MPRRPREHQIEDESRRAFEAALPSRFVYRPFSPDYGLDGEVEEFDEDELATGLRFYVQLKATDQLKLGKALKVSLPLEHADQRPLAVWSRRTRPAVYCVASRLPCISTTSAGDARSLSWASLLPRASSALPNMASRRSRRASLRAAFSNSCE